MANVIAETATMNEVRIDPRLPATAVPSISTVKLSPGETVTLINISATGVLVEGPTRFVPRTRRERYGSAVLCMRRGVQSNVGAPAGWRPAWRVDREWRAASTASMISGATRPAPKVLRWLSSK